ncbi:MAG TPA: molybdate ABC transporter permease subunit [Chloroflexi bacterium]|nr:molybdate ABC transporter permease subunit [Chloroflexota bacterium]HHW86728.1 molybdate ABC transporter permease subunit [Chloroflexota bacterium]
MFDANWAPLRLSLQVTLTATLLVLFVGVPLAWLLARKRFPGRDALGAIVMLPLVLPPTVLGYYLLVTLGAQSPLGRWLAAIGFPLVFTWRGAVIAAAIAAFPLMVESVRTGFESVDPRLEGIARTLGRSEWAIFWRVTLPLAWRSIVAGTALTFARALGDFGATLMVAGNIPGRTQTMSLYIYDLVQANRQGEANQMVLLITVLAVTLLVVARRLNRRVV